MKFTIAKKELLRVVTLAARATEAKASMPILSQVLLRADSGDGGLTVTGTDLYTTVTATTRVAVHEARGAVAVTAKDIISRIKAFPNGATLSVTATNGPAPVLTIASGATSFNLRGMPSEDYPPLSKDADPKARRYAIPADTLYRLLDGTSYAVSRDETRTSMNATRIEIGETFYRAVATDGHRATKIDVAREVPCAPKRKARIITEGAKPIEALLLQFKATTELARIAKAASGDVEVSVTDKNATFAFDEACIVVATRVVDAQFPPYGQAIPTSQQTIVELPRQAFIDAVKAVALTADRKTGCVKLVLSPGKLVLSAVNAATGDGSVSVDLPSYAKSHVPIGFNYRYLVEACGAIGDDTITMGLSGVRDPATFTKSGRGEEYIACVMPMSLVKLQ